MDRRLIREIPIKKMTHSILSSQSVIRCSEYEKISIEQGSLCYRIRKSLVRLYKLTYRCN